MELWQSIGTALGLGFLSGYRLYLTVFLAGLGSRLGWFSFDGSMAHLGLLADDRVMIVSGIACVVEFLADKIPWVDSIWDAIHTFIRPVGAALLGSAVATGMDPGWKLVLALLAGGVALTGHSSKAAARLVVNHSPEPFTNIAASLLGDMSIPLGLYVVANYPLWALGGVCLFLLVFVWIAPRVFRLLRLELSSIGMLLGRLVSHEPLGLEPVPADLRAAAASRLGTPPQLGLRCAAGRSVNGLKHSVGWLCPTDRALVFVTRRMMRRRVHVIDRANLRLIGFDRGLLLHTLTLDLGDREQHFECFAGTTPRIVDALQDTGMKEHA
jgi:hypothetical protein